MCPVSKPTKTLSCFLFMPKAEHDNYLLGLLETSWFVQTTTISRLPHIIMCVLSAHDHTSVPTVIIAIPICDSVVGALFNI